MVDNFKHQLQSSARPTTRQSQQEKFILENDAQCGLSPEGRGTNCELDCQRIGSLYKDPECLRDCDIPRCLQLLMEDHITHNGVCAGSVGHTENNWANSATTCQMSGLEVVEGLCRNQTIQELIQQRCMNDIFSLPYHLRNTILSIIRSMCRYEVYGYFSPRSCGLDCIRTLTTEGWVALEDSSCQPDCICTQSLITDYYNAGGVCAGSYADVILGWPVSSQTCQMGEGTSTNFNDVREGLCRPETLQSLIQQSCINEVWSFSEKLRNSIRSLIRSICENEVYNYFYPRAIPACEQDCVNIDLLPSPPNPERLPLALSSSGAMIYQDLKCLSDCTVLEPNCVSLLLTDYYRAGGVCEGSWGYNNFGLPASTQSCNMYEDSVLEGLCRPETEKAMVQPKCLRGGFI